LTGYQIISKSSFMIKYLFFDIYQTLLDVDIEQKNIDTAWKVFEDYLIKKNVNLDEARKFKLYFDQAESLFYQDRDKLLYHHDWIENIYSVMKTHYGMTISSSEAKSLLWSFRKISCDFCRVYPGVKVTLEKLSKSYTLSTASLAHESITKIELDETGLSKYFSHFIFTSGIGYRKPSEEFYRRMLQEVGATADVSFMIGDNLRDDIFGASRVGMHTIWIMNPLSMNNKIDVKPDYSVKIENFPEIVDVISLHNDRISM